MADTLGFLFTEEQYTRLTEALGLPPDSDVDTVLATVDDLVTTPTDPAAAAAIIAAAGMETIDTASLDALRAEAEQGRTVAAAAETRRLTGVVEAAVGKGKIPPARRDHWVTVLTADPTMERTLASMPDDLIPTKEIGHSVDSEPVVEQAAWFR